MKESSNRNDFRTIDLRKPSARRAPVSWRRSTTLRIVMTPRPTEKVPKFGPKLFGMTDPSTSARPGFDWMAAQAAAASGYAGSRAWSSNGGIEPEGTPIRLVLKRRPAKLAFALTWRRARDRPSVPFVMFFQIVCAPDVANAAPPLAY